MNKMKFPRGFNRSRNILDFPPHEYSLYIPDAIEFGIDKGFYVGLSGFAMLMRYNKENPEIIQFLADMLS